MAIKINKGKVFYKVWVNKADISLDFMKQFLQSKGVIPSEISKLDVMGENKQIPITLNGKDFSLTIDRSQERELILLFGCSFDTDEYNKFMEGWFQ